jgi:protein phosphatase
VVQPLTLEVAARTEVGRRRKINQDALGIRPDLGIFILADGMGGHPAGELAASIAVEAMAQFYLDAGATWPPDAEGPATDPRAFLIAAVKHANFRIRQHAERTPEHAGLGAAVAAVHVGGSGFCLAHVGHVRAYRVRDGLLTGLTEDDTRMNNYLWQGVAYDVAERMPDAHTLARAVGLSTRVRVTARLEDARAGDLILLVSNGLYNAISDAQMARILAERTTLAAIANNLVGVAQAHHAADDVSCILLRWIGGDEEKPPLAA